MATIGDCSPRMVSGTVVRMVATEGGMMGLLGIDVGRNLPVSNANIVELGVNWVRAPITPDAPAALHGRIRQLRNRGVKTVLVIDRSALGGMSFEEAARFYREAYGDVAG